MDKPSSANWKTQLRKGFLDLCILNCLRAREFYGYDLVQELKKLDGAQIREGIIYPILARMQEDELVTSEKRPSTAGPPRKYYHITQKGKDALDEMNGFWRQLAEAVDAAMNLEKERPNDQQS